MKHAGGKDHVKRIVLKWKMHAIEQSKCRQSRESGLRNVKTFLGHVNACQMRIRQVLAEVWDAASDPTSEIKTFVRR